MPDSGFTREPWEWGPSVAEEMRRKQATPEAIGAKVVRALDEQTAALKRLPSMLYTPDLPTLSAADIDRIAEAVVDKLAARAASPLAVTDAEVRRFFGGKT